jgi:hypothetical protein
MAGTSTRRKTAAKQRRFAVCIRNDGYEASLERNKIYASWLTADSASALVRLRASATRRSPQWREHRGGDGHRHRARHLDAREIKTHSPGVTVPQA